MPSNLLLVEDDRPIREFVSDLLKEEGFIVHSVASGSECLKQIKHRQPDLVILDLGLPDISGDTVLTEIRKITKELPVIILSARNQTKHIVKGLSEGADDYLPKPFEAEELLARVRARLRAVNKTDNNLEINNIKINLLSQEVTKENKLISLTKTEFDLLVYLAKNQGIVLTREMILNHVWGYTTDVESRVVDVYIGYLRKKLGVRGQSTFIISKRGYGYYLKPQPIQSQTQKVS